MTIKLISAVSKNGVIGISTLDGFKLPWYYPEDMKYFKEMTLNSTVIYGRNTAQSMGYKPLPKRRNIVITRTPISGLETCKSIGEALEIIGKEDNIWFIGGSNIYWEAMNYCDELHITIIPEVIDSKDAIIFPWINPDIFSIKETQQLPNSQLKVLIYKRN